MLYGCIQPILIAIECARVRRPGPSRLIERADIATCSKRSVTRAADCNSGYGRVARPLIQRFLHCNAHDVRKCIERLRSVQCNETEVSLTLKEDFRVRHL